MTVKKGSVQFPVFEDQEELLEYLGQLRKIMNAARQLMSAGCIAGEYVGIAVKDYNAVKDAIKAFDDYGHV